MADLSDYDCVCVCVCVCLGVGDALHVVQWQMCAQRAATARWDGGQQIPRPWRLQALCTSRCAAMPLSCLRYARGHTHTHTDAAVLRVHDPPRLC
jgi:hypothetical protein